MSYNTTALQNSTSVFKLFQYADDSTGNVLVGFLVIALFFVLIMRLKQHGVAEALMTASFVSFVISAMFAYIELLNFYYVLVFFAILALTALYVFVVKRD